MEEILNLSTSFNDSINNEVTSIVGEIAEVGLDAILKDELLKEIPFISTAISLYKIGSSISEKHHIKKLAVFINEINNKTIDENKKKIYRDKIASNKSISNRELEYVLVLIDRYLDYKKPKMLATLYLSFLDDEIAWNTFSELAEIIDRLLLSDIDCLREFYYHGGVTIKENIVPLASVLRLLSVGFVEQQVQKLYWDDIEESTHTQKNKTNFDYYITDFGKLFIGIFKDELLIKKSFDNSNS